MDHVGELYVPFEKLQKIVEKGYIKKYIKNQHLEFFKKNKKAFEKKIQQKIMNENFGGDFFHIDL